VSGFGLLRTTDGGRTWHEVRGPASATFALTFADSHVGFALTGVGTGTKTQLWKTTDAGAVWHVVPIR
jgi:photosystem II stability/assembly factor-like uncharacterized protein